WRAVRGVNSPIFAVVVSGSAETLACRYADSDLTCAVPGSLPAGIQPFPFLPACPAVGLQPIARSPSRERRTESRRCLRASDSCGTRGIYIRRYSLQALSVSITWL